MIELSFSEDYSDLSRVEWEKAIFVLKLALSKLNMSNIHAYGVEIVCDVRWPMVSLVKRKFWCKQQLRFTSESDCSTGEYKVKVYRESLVKRFPFFVWRISEHELLGVLGLSEQTPEDVVRMFAEWVANPRFSR